MTKIELIQDAIGQLETALTELTNAKQTVDYDPDKNFTGNVANRLNDAAIFINVALADIAEARN